VVFFTFIFCSTAQNYSMQIIYFLFLASVSSLLVGTRFQAQSFVISSDLFSLIPSISSSPSEIEQRALTILHTLTPMTSHSIPLLGRYRELLSIYPLPTQVLTGGTLAIVGDAIGQRTDKGYYVYDSRRGVSFMAFDMTYRTVQHFIFPWVSLHFHGQYLSALVTSLGIIHQDQPLFAAIEETLVNQLLVVPLFYYPAFFSFTAIIQGQSVLEGVQRAKSMFLPLMQRNLAYWLPVQFIQFRYIEENFQIPFVCLAGLCWTIILSASAGSSSSPVSQRQGKDFVELMSFKAKYVRDRKQ
jgi:hypothetical protein